MSGHLSQKNDEIISCRSYGHAWSPEEVLVTRNQKGTPVTYTAKLRCVRCDTLKHQKYDSEGNILSTSYGYLPDYLVSDGATKLEARVEFIARAFRPSSKIHTAMETAQ